MTKFKQGHRELSIDTPLGSDVLLLTRFTGTEALSAPFEYELELLSEKPDINFSDILGKNVSVSLSAKSGALSAASSIRYFNGYISRFEQTHSEGNIYHYSAVMVPWLWFLKRRRDCRIFQKLTVPEIVQRIFSDLGFSSVVDNALTATYRTWDYCVQYRETDFDFVSRLLENEGIYYFFKHEKDAQSGNITHKLVLADGVSASVNINGDSSISYLGPDRAAKGEYIRDWKLRQALQSGNFMLNDYDFTAPKKSLLASAANTAGVVSQTDHRVYDYPGGYTQSSDGGNYVQARMQEQQAGFAVASGNSNNRGVEAGYLFTLADHPVSAMNQTYLIQSAHYDIRNENYLQDQPGPVETTFTCNLTCFESSQQFRPARITPKAVVRGPQTAVVVGPSGEKIYTDEYGRVKVQFYWDTYGTSDQNSSCWIRVSQSWAGAPNNGLNWGDMALPHVGDEVIVDFLEGNPDKPLITGRVYNADNMPPESLPANKHRRIMQDDYGNRVILDATPGDEHIRLYSPHHQSDLQLGRSVQHTTQSNTYGVTYGNNWSCTAGTVGNAVLGSEVAICAGGYVNAKGGIAYQSTLGMSYTFNGGYKFEWDKSGELIIHDSSTSSVTKDDVIMAAGGKIYLAGGDAGQKASPQYTSVVQINNSGIELEVGPEKEISPPGTNIATKLIFGLVGLIPLAGMAMMAAGPTFENNVAQSSLSGSATSASIASGSYTAPQSISQGINSTGLTDTSDPTAAGLDAAGLAVMALGMVVTMVYSAYVKSTEKAIELSAHGESALGAIKIETSGSVKVESMDGPIILRHKAGKNSVRLVKTGGVSIESPNNNIMLKATNIKLNGSSGVTINGSAIQVAP